MCIFFLERAIVNHPHYEDVGARERTKAVYTVFSRREAKEVYDILASMQVGSITTPKDWYLEYLFLNELEAQYYVIHSTKLRV